MKSNLLMNFTVDKENKKIRVQREFAASLENVWDAWTKSELLDQWWAPKPYQAKTKSMDFRAGGTWLYAMMGPDGSVLWCKADYKSIQPLKNFSWMDAFCDESGKTAQDFPGSLWFNSFKGSAQSTIVDIEITYQKPEDLEKIIEMGFKEGFTAGLENLDVFLGS